MSERSILFLLWAVCKRSSSISEYMSNSSLHFPSLLLSVDWMFPLHIKSVMNAGLIIFFFSQEQVFMNE